MAGEYKGWPLYAPAELDRIAVAEAAVLEWTVTERRAWLHASLNRYATAKELGRRVREFDRGRQRARDHSWPVRPLGP